MHIQKAFISLSRPGIDQADQSTVFLVFWNNHDQSLLIYGVEMK